MLPKFEIRQHSDGRWFVETDWHVPMGSSGVGWNMLQVTTSGKLDTASAGWSTEAKAKTAMEQCKARLR